MSHPFMPFIIEKNGNVERHKDVFTRLYQDRIIFLGDEVDMLMSNVIIAQLLYLASESSEDDIYMYINSPGGIVTAGLAIYDTMQYIKPDINTICVGQAASMGAFLLAAGTPGKRIALKNADIMIHQPSGGFGGQETDIQIHAKHIARTKEKLTRYLSEFTGQTFEKVAEDCERDNYMSADEAKEYGLVDDVTVNVTKKKEE
jgi:ATP-dependent Clp protease protease subunit